MKLKVKNKMVLYNGKALSPRKFYDATHLSGGTYILLFAENHKVIVGPDQIKEIKTDGDDLN